MSDMSPATTPSGADRAAVMVMLLGEEDAARLLGRLSPEELRVLGAKMCELGEISPATIADAISNFASSANQSGISAHGRLDSVRRMMVGAVGDLKAENIMRSLAPEEQSAKTPALDLARWLEPEVLIPLVSDEPPQAIAVLLVQLDPVVAAKVLAGLPEHLHTPVVHRIAKLGPVSPDAIEILEQTLSTKISRAHGKSSLKMGGVRGAAEIINNSGRVLEKRIMPALGKLDKQLAKQLEQEMFKFEHLYVLDAQMMGQLLREVDGELLIDALKGIPDDERDHFFRAMSSRAADGLRDEIESRGRIKRADVEAAQQKILIVAKKLAAEGLLVFGDSGEDEYV
ncbi:flagellar motor switch protein FliG [Altererythrobacter atlanticus]|uniref:Flagellar motor switch protein FliG n=1 Tax=Croceibacterium atlanticum TaxID=1267766 RepID=A0A0F7KZA3_9SPHN|nr:flagellar motor switch protein FliG [Croceibacterium atlanticum]AKH44165.1 Flagellar motor switch protein FliG [Croceibacterium atlanticum]MBB5732476.1 flagellar motor switch protein FliG [Croceibacterium atlanticum]